MNANGNTKTEVDESPNVYIALEQSVLVRSKKVQIEDIATVFCPNPDLSHQIKKTEVLVFTDSEQEYAVVTIMRLIALVHELCKQASVNSIGTPETIVYYRNLTDGHKNSGRWKAFMLMILAFFGTSYSIMAYNEDVGATELLSNLYKLFTGKTETVDSAGLLLGALAYSVGLCLGMIVFFNHGINKKKVDDPTPLQVQMRLYEDDVNKTIIVNSEREGTTVDLS